MKARVLAALFCATALTVQALAVDTTIETSIGDVSVATFVDGLTHPWGLAFLPEGGMLVTERPGTLRYVTADGALSEPIAGLPQVDARGQGGLLDVALDPDFANTRLVYLSYAEPAANGTNSTAVARATLDAGNSALSGLEVIFSQQPKLRSNYHFGSRLAFDADGYLFITTGDRSDPPYRVRAQDLDSHVGKIIRIRADGSVPDDNPFVGVAGALPEIWSYGHRNPQGLAIRPETGQVWSNEHGPRGGDELNLIAAGNNYGWPLVTHGTEYSGAPINPPADLPDDLVEPVAHWSPSPAFSGLMFYTGEMFPEWAGDAFMGALAGTTLYRIRFDGDRVLEAEAMLTHLGLRIRDVQQGPDGALYLLTDEWDGEILRLSTN